LRLDRVRTELCARGQSHKMGRIITGFTLRRSHASPPS
jgi:hypothetical protein